ncbi:MAG: hypothetical protein M5U34_46360 [Chloroflexi bacterium]|nr:hypothetical protein [Chloroflexota bacterium]
MMPGTGVGEVVQDCEYHKVYADYCEYVIDEWQVVDTRRSEGQNFNVSWPTLQLTPAQREGSRATDYIITFRTDGESYTARPSGRRRTNAAVNRVPGH